MQSLICGDCLRVMSMWPDGCVDMVFGSPPYEDCRDYGIDFKLKGQAWVDWMVEIYRESLRISRGLVSFVVAGKTKNFKWSCTPALLIADLHRAGVCVREGPYFHRVSIPGSGGPDWLRHDIEFIVSTSKGRLPWSDNTVMGHPPKYKAGGKPSYRRKSGVRQTWKDGKDRGTWGVYQGDTLCNPGTLLSIPVGGNIMGNSLCHKNEAPFPEQLAEFMIRSFCRPGGVVVDPFLGSGTTCAVAKKYGRGFIGIDIRESQLDITRERLKETK